MPQDTPNTGEESTTTSTMKRWKCIGTILAGAMVLSLPAITGGAALGTLALSPIGQE